MRRLKAKTRRNLVHVRDVTGDAQGSRVVEVGVLLTLLTSEEPAQSSERFFHRTVTVSPGEPTIEQTEPYARCAPPSVSNAFAICPTQCATSSSRSVRSLDWSLARIRIEYLPTPTFSLWKISTGTKLRS